MIHNAFANRRQLLGLLFATAGVGLAAGCSTTSAAVSQVGVLPVAHGLKDVPAVWQTTMNRFAGLRGMPSMTPTVMATPVSVLPVYVTTAQAMGEPDIVVLPELITCGTVSSSQRAAVLAYALAQSDRFAIGSTNRMTPTPACTTESRGQSMVQLMAGAGFDPRALLRLDDVGGFLGLDQETKLAITCQLRAMGYRA
jgi:hypothetical protein